MDTYEFDRPLTSEEDALDYYVAAIQYRNKHKDRSIDIALHVFRRTNPKGMLSFPVSDNFERIRYEFASLEAPGMPEDDEKDPDEYVDDIWQLLLNRVEEAKKSRTV